MKIITIGNLKGGVGKSLILLSLSSLMAKKRKKVLILDVDPQANTTNNFGIDDSSLDYMSVADIFENNEPPSNVVIKRPIEPMATVDILPSSILLSVTETLLVTKTARETILKDYIEQHKQFFNKYDYILIDTSPSLSLLNQNCFAVSDSILLISDIGMNSFKGIKLLMNSWDSISKKLKLQNNIKGVLVNRYDKRIKLSKEFTEFLRENEEIRDISFKTFIPENVKLKESEIEVPIAYYDTKCTGYLALKEWYKELEEREII